MCDAMVEGKKCNKAKFDGSSKCDEHATLNASYAILYTKVKCAQMFIQDDHDWVLFGELQKSCSVIFLTFYREYFQETRKRGNLAPGLQPAVDWRNYTFSIWLTSSLFVEKNLSFDENSQKSNIFWSVRSKVEPKLQFDVVMIHSEKKQFADKDNTYLYSVYNYHRLDKNKPTVFAIFDKSLIKSRLSCLQRSMVKLTFPFDEILNSESFLYEPEPQPNLSLDTCRYFRRHNGVQHCLLNSEDDEKLFTSYIQKRDEFTSQFSRFLFDKKLWYENLNLADIYGTKFFCETCKLNCPGEEITIHDIIRNFSSFFDAQETVFVRKNWELIKTPLNLKPQVFHMPFTTSYLIPWQA